MKIRGYEIKPGADLTDADLTGTNLRGAILYGANLTCAILTGVDLTGADLTNAILTDADLTCADLRGANLTRAILTRANLTDAELTDAELTDAELTGAILPFFQIPQYGDLTVFKKLKSGVIAKLRIPNNAKRTASLVGRKCRAEYVEVLELFNCDGDIVDSADSWCSNGLHVITYRVGDVVYPDKYCDDIRVECSHGIHFFLTLEEALDWWDYDT
jgi:hypothetical protein